MFLLNMECIVVKYIYIYIDKWWEGRGPSLPHTAGNVCV